MSDEGDSSSTYPRPFVVEPTSEHKETWIVLHGRGDTGRRFSQGFMGVLNMALPDGRTLQEHLPYVRFVFPTASPRHARVFNRATITQWFDIYSWNSTERTQWQIQGLRETTAWVSELVRRESDIVGAQNVVVGGLSQGCASVLAWNLVQSEQKVRCVFGMSGWLPFRHILELYLPKAQDGTQEGTEDVFEEDSNSIQDPYVAAVKALLQELEMETNPTEIGKHTPLFLGHGKEDEKVDFERGREAAQCLLGLGCNVQWTEYEGLEHWFHGEELMDIVQFVGRQTSSAPVTGTDLSATNNP